MIEKKLVLCAILAITMGIATIVPLEYFMSAQAQTQTNSQIAYDKPWFNVNIPYAYYTGNATNNQNGVISNGEGYYIALNITTNPEAMKTLPDSRLEYYQIQVYSDQGPIENFTYVICTNCTGSTNPYITLPYANYFNAGDFFNDSLTAISIVPAREWVFLPNFNGTLPASHVDWQSDTNYTLTSEGQAISSISESFWNGILIQGINMTNIPPEQQGQQTPNGATNQSSNMMYIPMWIQLQQVSNIQNAHSLYVDISRIGYVTMNDNSTTATQADNSIIQHVELTPYQDGFLYNTVIPQEKLAQTNLEAPTIP
jgi:hypothetical protein